jgi:Flp pilus assembly pilin Flp
MVEYGLMIALIAVACMGAAQLLGNQLSNLCIRIADTLQMAT